MAVPSGRTLYKKKEGILTVAGERNVTWTPLPGNGPPVVSLAIANITNLQQTPPDNPKVVLRIYAKPASGDGDPVSYVFHFVSPDNPRPEADAVKELLSRLIAEIRSNDAAVPTPAAAAAEAGRNSNGNGNGNGPTATSRAANPRWYDDSELVADTELQRSVMKKDSNLYQVYLSARQSKPDTVSDTEFMARFFSTRTSLLRAHAIETSQEMGAYNVLSTVKPKTVEGELKLSLSAEQIKMILSQHPLVMRIYNENVPKLKDNDFWSRFFLSKLSKKLRGERVEEGHPSDPLFDQYSEADDAVFSSKIMSGHVPRTIDLEGNEENQGGFKGGNRKDAEMRPRSDFPVVKMLNSLSEKIMARVAPSDPDALSEPAAHGDTNPHGEFALRDLGDEPESARIELNVKEQGSFFSNQKSAPSADAAVFAKQVASEVLFEVQADLDTLEEDGAGGLDLHTGGVDEESDSDEEVQRPPHVGSRAARRRAQEALLRGLSRRRADESGASSDETLSPMGISADITQKAYITSATSTEFLKQFWSAFLSGDPARAQELAYHVEALKKSVTRIEAVAEEAEGARNKVIAQRREEIRAVFQRTGKKIKWRGDNVGGGRKAVLTLLGSTMSALERAQKLYREACIEQGFQPPTEG